MRSLATLLWLLCWWGSLSAQPYIRRYLPGNFQGDRRWYVEIQNPAAQVVNISGYFLATRGYVYCVPQGSVIPANGSRRFATTAIPGWPVDELLTPGKNLIFRPYNVGQIGDYCILFNAAQQVADAFYFAPARRVEFLAEGMRPCVCGSNLNENCLTIPSARSPVWKFREFSLGYDPLIGFEQRDGRWCLLSISSKQTICDDVERPAIKSFAVQELDANYAGGLVTLHWQIPRDVAPPDELRLERSRDGVTFSAINTIALKPDVTTYTATDDRILPDQVYYYRLSYRAPTPAVSRTAQVTTTETEAFRLEILPAKAADARQIQVHCASTKTQSLTVKVLDGELREVGILYYGRIDAGAPLLLQAAVGLPAGGYTVVASTEDRRYFGGFEVLKK